MNIDYPTAFKSWDDAERVAIERVIASDRFTMAGEVEVFEGEFAAWHNRKHGIMVNSGSSANLIAVAAAAHRRGGFRGSHGLRVGDFAAPAIAWATTYAPAIQFGLSPVIVDVDDTWNAVETLTVPPMLILTCSVLGNPAYLAGWEGLAKAHGCPMIEDNCESLGARTADGRLTGTFGDMSTFSFFHSHQLSAIEGGMVLTDDDELAQLCRLLRNHGNSGWGSDDFEATYNFKLFGYNLRPLEIHAAVAREQLKKLPEFIEARRTNDALFRSLTYNLLSVTLQRPNGTPSPFALAFTIETREQRRRLATELRAEGIDCRLPTGGSFLRHAYAEPWAYQRTPYADRTHDTGMFLGNAPYDIAPLIERAVKVMRRVL